MWRNVHCPVFLFIVVCWLRSVDHCSCCCVMLLCVVGLLLSFQSAVVVGCCCYCLLIVVGLLLFCVAVVDCHCLLVFVFGCCGC